MPLFWICGSWFPLSLLKCGGGRGGWEAAVLLVVHLLRQTGSDDALRSAPPANSARPGAPKVVSSKTLLRFEISPGCVFACCAALVPGFIAVFKGESAHFYAEWGIHAKTLRINLSFIVASEDITPGLGGGLGHYQRFSVSSCWWYSNVFNFSVRSALGGRDGPRRPGRSWDD